MSVVRRCLLHFVALGAPLAAYQFIPVLNVTLPELAAVMLAPVVMLGWRGRRWPLPFELWWPSAAAGLLCGYGGYWGAACWPLAFIVVFLAIRTRGDLRIALYLAVIGGALGAFISLGAQWGWVYSTDATAAGTPFGALMADGSAELVEMAFLAVVAVGLVGKRDLPLRTRAAAGLAALALSAAMLGLLLRLLQGDIQADLRVAPDLAPPALLAAVLAAWLACRVLAKLALLHHRLGAPLAQPLFTALAVASLLTVFLLPVPPLVFAVLVAMAARATTPLRAESHEERATLWAIPVVVLLLVNLVFVSAANPRDPRNYEAAAGALLANRESGELSRRLDALQVHFDEPRLDLWRSRLALARGDITAAADAFVRAAGAAAGASHRPLGRLGAPEASEFTAVLDQFRDVVSGLPEGERGLSYERMLVAAGESSSALASLRFRATGSGPAVDVEAAAANIATRLGDPALAAVLREWSSAELAAICAHLGGCS